MRRIIFKNWLPLFIAVEIAVSMACAAEIPSNQATIERHTEIPPLSTPDGFTLAAVGDLIYPRPMLPRLMASAPHLVDLLQSATVTFGNFEANALDLATFEGYPAADSGGAWILASQEVPSDLKSMGFDLVALANNHTMDWGSEGVFETQRVLTQAGLVHAGSGATLSAARAPRYLEIAEGRIALVAAASTFPYSSRAADPLGEIRGRPGVSALRRDRKDGKMHPQDRDQIIKAIRQAKQNSNFVVVSLHNHESNGKRRDVPAEFAIEFAHEAIESGADAVIGHGPHVLRGIEIYQGKPIFYSLGNFFFMLQALEPIPLDLYENYQTDPESMTASEFMNRRNYRIHDAAGNYDSVLAVSRYAGGEVKEIRLYPVELAESTVSVDRGVPRLASPERGRKILEGLRSLSKPFGTDVQITDNMGVVTQ